MVTTRPARVTDGERLRAIDVLTWSPDVTPGPRSRPDQPFFSENRGPDGVVVAELEGRVVGYATLHQAIRLPSHDHVLEMNGLAVDPDAQGRGVGRALMEAMIREARKRSARKLTLRVLAPNTTARRLYESCGFVVEGVLAGEFHIEGVDVDDILMALRIDPE